MFQKLEAEKAQQSELLRLIAEYKDCKLLIKDSIQNPAKEAETFQALLPCVEAVDAFFTYSKNLGHFHFCALFVNFFAETTVIPELVSFLSELDVAPASSASAAGTFTDSPLI